ncbi:MAG: creatininase family protein [Gemmatimonadales bacterium]
MSNPTPVQGKPLYIKYLTSDEVGQILQKRAQLIIPVGTTEQHGPHLPLGCDTIIVERLADDLSTEFQILRAPTIEYGVNAAMKSRYPGTASLSRKTLHRLLNDLVASWEAGGIEQFIILTAHGQDPHQEALSTLSSRHATISTVDIFAVPHIGSDGDSDIPIHGGELDTSLLLYVDATLVELGRARDYVPLRRYIRRYHRGSPGAMPPDSPGSLGHPTRATIEKGEQLYHVIYERIARRLFRREEVG